MLNHKLLSPDGILILEPSAPLEAADFAALLDAAVDANIGGQAHVSQRPRAG